MKVIADAKVSHKDYAACNEKATVKANNSCDKQRDLDCNKKAR